MSSKQQQEQQSMHNALAYEAALLTANTTFVQADPSNFRAIVQHLTGPQQPQPDQPMSFKLHERRQQQQGHSIRKLEMIKLNNNNINGNHGPTNGVVRPMVSPVSTLDGLGLRIGSPSPRRRRSMSMSEEEERVVIAEKGFYLHPVSSLNGGANNNSRDYNEPQLLPLFPLQSPTNNNGQDY